MTPYRSRRYTEAEPEPTEPEALPLDLDNADPPDLRTHDGLNAAATAAGHTWTAPDLTAQAKRDELNNLDA